MNSFHVYIALIAVLDLNQSQLCKVNGYNFLELGSSYTGMLPFIDTTMILKNFLKSNKNARNFYSAFELGFYKGSWHKNQKNEK